jgi:peptidoglycan/xylan/chitin deacetylase (PgdA/CDA1 family)
VKKRRPIPFVFVLGVALVALSFYASRPRAPDPVYEGKRLSEWLDRVYAHNDQTEVDEAAAAIRHIGTNAVPFLLQELQAEAPFWVRTIQRIEGRLPFSIDLPSADTRIGRAITGFVILGATAAPAIPRLTEVMLHAPTQNATAAVEALRLAGGTNAVPIFIRGLTNLAGWPQVWTAQALGSLTNYSAPAVPALLANLASSDATVRSSCASALGKIASQSELVVPALTKLLADPDRNVRRSAASALGEFKGSALPAVPALRVAASDPIIRSSATVALLQVQCEWSHDAIVRGPKDEKKIALMFTGHEYAEGAETILNELARHRVKASFFLTGDFLVNPNLEPIVQRIVAEDHLLGPHSDKHLLYCSWDAERKLLVTRNEFRSDLEANLEKIRQLVARQGGKHKAQPPPPSNPDSPEEQAFRARYGLSEAELAASDYPVRYFLPPYEHYNQQIADWTREMGMTLINFTPGTRSNADYTGEADKNFVSSQVIFDSIVKKEREDPNGLNGFLLFLHLGAGPGRADKFHPRFGELLDYLAGKGYEFVRVDELLELNKPDAAAPKNDPNSTP